MSEFENREENRVWKENLKNNLKNVLRPCNTKTVKFDSSMTTAEMQALIDAQHKYIPYGASLNFRPANGSYSISTTLLFSGFYGGGELNIYGSTADTSLSTTKSVYLDFSSGNYDALKVYRNTVAKIFVGYFKLKFGGGYSGVYFQENAGYVYASGMYVLGNTSGSGYCIQFQGGRGRVQNTYVSMANKGIYANELGHLYSSNNDDTGTQPTYGLAAYRALIHKSGTQPAGSTANELTANGGQIW